MKTLLIIVAICFCWVQVGALPEIHLKLQSLAADSRSNIMITMAKRTDTILDRIAAQVFPSRGARLNALHDALLAHAKLTQLPVMAALAPFTQAHIFNLALGHAQAHARSNSESITFTSYWISNQIFVRGASPALIDVLSLLSSISKIEPEFFIPLVKSVDVGHTKLSSTSTAPTNYGVAKVGAPKVWAEGFKGQNVTVATIDTGVRGTHRALKGRFLGPFGWYDPLLFTTEPNDVQGHGTHTMGIMTGGGGIGVAPEATWAACRGCDVETCSSDTLTACGQYFACPFTGETLLHLLVNHFAPFLSSFFPLTKDCSKAPHVISNSWGGAGNDTWFNDVVKAWRIARIVPVFAAGNSGPACETMSSPGDQTNVIGVGATNEDDSLASYSSVGPTVTGNIKPDIVAPGTNVVSSYFLSDSSYETLSGTSMATPHVAGVVALLLSKNKDLEYQQIYDILTQNGDRSVTGGQTCDGRVLSVWPNNSFGFGRVNASAAFQAA